MDASTSWHLLFCSLIAVPAAGHLLFVYRAKKPIEVIDLAYWIISFYFGLGPCVAFIYGKGALPFEDFDVLAWTYLSIGLFLAGLHVSKLIIRQTTHGERNASSGLFSLLGATHRVSFAALATSYVSVWAIRMLFVIKYGMGLSGTVNEETLANLPYHLFVISSILDVLAFGCVVCIAGSLFHETRRKGVALVIVLLEFVWFYGQGRRWVLCLLVVLGLAFLSTGKRPKPSQLALGGLVVVFLVGWAFPAFITFRNQYLASPSNRETLGGIIEAAETAMHSSKDESGDIYSDNMAQRPLIVGFNLRIAEAQKQYPIMWGGAFANSVLWTIPSLFYSGKQDLLNSEENIQHHYDLEMVDMSSNWPAFAMADFGCAGTLFVGIAFGFLLIALEHVAVSQGRFHPFLGFCILGAAVNIALTVEETPTFVWSTFRSLFLITLFLKVAGPLFKFTQIFGAVSDIEPSKAAANS